MVDVQPTAALSVEQRLARLEEERAILATMYRYGHTIDYGLEQDWLDCFTDDAVWDVRPRPGREGVRRVFSGRRELQGFISAHTRAPYKYHKHMLIEPAIELDGVHARVDSYFIRVDENREGVAYIMAFGRYRDVLVKCADGRWRFKERVVELEGGWPQP